MAGDIKGGWVGLGWAWNLVCNESVVPSRSVWLLLVLLRTHLLRLPTPPAKTRSHIHAIYTSPRVSHVLVLGTPLLSTLVLGRLVYSTWRLWRLEAYAPSVWLQVLTLTPALGGSSSSGGGGSSGSSRGGGGSSASGSGGSGSGGGSGAGYRP